MRFLFRFFICELEMRKNWGVHGELEHPSDGHPLRAPVQILLLIFLTEGNEGNEGAAALSIGFIFAGFLADGGARVSLEHPSFSSLPSVEIFLNRRSQR